MTPPSQSGGGGSRWLGHRGCERVERCCPRLLRGDGWFRGGPFINEGKSAVRPAVCGGATGLGATEALLHEIDDRRGLAAGFGVVSRSGGVTAGRHEQLGDEFVDDRLDRLGVKDGP